MCRAVFGCPTYKSPAYSWVEQHHDHAMPGATITVRCNVTGQSWSATCLNNNSWTVPSTSSTVYCPSTQAASFSTRYSQYQNDKYMCILCLGKSTFSFVITSTYTTTQVLNVVHELCHLSMPSSSPRGYPSYSSLAPLIGVWYTRGCNNDNNNNIYFATNLQDTRNLVIYRIT